MTSDPEQQVSNNNNNNNNIPGKERVYKNTFGVLSFFTSFKQCQIRLKPKDDVSESLCKKEKEREGVCVCVCDGLFAFCMFCLASGTYVRTFFLFFKLGYLFRLYSVYLCVCIRS